MNTIHRTLPILMALLFVLGSSGCYRFTVRPPNSQIAEYHGQTVHAVGWNLFKEDPIVEAANCGDRGLYAARAKTNVFYIAISAFTFGFWVPMRVEWRCVAPDVVEGGADAGR